jgi:HEAT repeat protein
VIGTQHCPSCGKPLDPMHAPVARIRGGKVVSFCSAGCAAVGTNEEPLRSPRAVMPALARPEPRLTPAPPTWSAEPVPPRPELAEPRRAPRLSKSHDHLELEEAVPSVRPSRARGVILALSVLVLAGGVWLLATEMLPPGGAAVESTTPAADPATSQEPERATAGAAARRPPIDGASPRAVSALPATEPPPTAAASAPSEANRESAITELRALMASTSPRVRRLAAQAMARAGDEAALVLLRRLQREEPSQLGRIQIAYALARAGDAQARQDLRIQLGSERRDVRVDAARCLLQLGDESGRKTLRAMLSVDAHRIGAAGLLARMGDDEGLKVLREEAVDKRATPEAKMRAQVALGRAGDESVRPALRKILEDKRYNVGAADALAALGDEAAAPALTVQLGLSAMRVPAALWLRRMKRAVDVAPLIVAMSAADEQSRVSAAEALLILSGPPRLAERD